MHCLTRPQFFTRRRSKVRKYAQNIRSTSCSATKSKKNIFQPSICVIHSLTVAPYEYFFYFFHAKFNEEKDFSSQNFKNVCIFALHFPPPSKCRYIPFYFVTEVFDLLVNRAKKECSFIIISQSKGDREGIINFQASTSALLPKIYLSYFCLINLKIFSDMTEKAQCFLCVISGREFSEI